MFRWTVLGSVVCLVFAAPEEPSAAISVVISLAILVVTNFLVHLVPSQALRATPFGFALALLDTVLISYVAFRTDATGFLCLFFFVLVIATAVSNRLGQVLLASLILGALYLLVCAIPAGWAGVLSVRHLMVLPLFYSAGLHFGYQVLDARASGLEADQVNRERRELRVVLNILASISNAPNLHTVMFEIASRIAEVLDSIRCSILLLEEGTIDRGFVLAASDDQKLKMLPVDLTRYPEVQQAIRLKRAVMIEDVEKSELLQPHLEQLRRLGSRSLLVLPILHQEVVIGALFFRASRTRAFSEDEREFCRLIASAVSSSMRNSVLDRSLEKRSLEQTELVAQVRDYFDNSPDLILYLDSDGTIREANRAAEHAAGRPRSEIVSQNFASIIRGLPPVADLTERTREPGALLAYDGQIRVAGKANVDLSVTISASRTSKGGLILIGRDVTAQNMATAMLQHQEKLSSIGEIVATVAHELNNPLAGVQGFAQLLSGKDTEGKFKREVDRILECSERCQKIVRNLLTFARPTPPDRKSTGLNEILEKTLDLLGPSLGAANIEVVKDLAANLPEVHVDFHQIQQVLTNLITNAQHAMTADRNCGRLTIRTYLQNDQVVLQIADDGPGITAEVLPRIFDPFFSTKKAGKGTGLGLSVSHGIVRDHGGELRVETKVGQGTTFVMLLPTRKETGAEAVKDQAADLKGKKFLVVDDEGLVIDVFLQLLRILGHDIDTASDGVEALRKIESRDYDLIIADLWMPRMDGIELYQKVLWTKPKMRRRFIFITGDMQALTSQQFLTIADSPCLTKPVNLEEMESTIRQVLAQPNLARVGDVNFDKLLGVS